jgi:hypothetical protein
LDPIVALFGALAVNPPVRVISLRVPRSHQKLDALAQMLERTSGDPLRLELVQRAQRFKRSWVELAEGLQQLRGSRAFEAWGFADLHEYCAKELSIRPATVDKLLLSLSTLTQHAPEVLQRDGVARNIPSIDAVDFYTRALGDEQRPGPLRRLDAPDTLLDQLRSAVFDEGQSVRELRDRFTPVMNPRSEGDERLEHARKTRSAAQRLRELVPEVRGLSEARVGRVLAALEALLTDLDGLIEKPSAARTARKRGARADA